MADATDPYTNPNYEAEEDKDLDERTGDTGQDETEEPDEADKW